MHCGPVIGFGFSTLLFGGRQNAVAEPSSDRCLVLQDLIWILYSVNGLRSFGQVQTLAHQVFRIVSWQGISRIPAERDGLRIWLDC